MPRLLVTPLSSLADALQSHAPSHLVSLLSPEHLIQTPESFPAAAHLRLGVNDIVDPAAGTAPPVRQHIDALLAFSRLSPVERQGLREGARGRWASRFSAERNYRVFARHLAYLSHITT